MYSLDGTNWKEIERDGILWTEIKTKDGYLWPDCSYECAYCGGCLGCIRKLILVDINEAFCDKSPTGLHEVKDEP